MGSPDGTPPPRSVADPHCHTTASDGMVSPQELVEAAVGLRLRLIAITDHDTMANAEEVRERGGEAGLAVIKGQEVTTAWPPQTHVLAWFLERPIPGGRPLEWTVDAIHDQGGLAIVPHPFMPTWFASCQPAMLRRLIEGRTVDGVELLHTAPMTAGRLRRLRAFYEEHEERLGAAIGSSDSHFGRHDLGRALTDFEGSSVEDFRRGVLQHTVRPLPGRQVNVPAWEVIKQQRRSLIELPLRRLTGQLE
ncbi:MAG: PHP domain-containing protein [Candidatus Dormibacteraeota bacterium]|nr:PHP domain-containing protein [Candidatus Dormibacteraeota bacterium]